MQLTINGSVGTTSFTLSAEVKGQEELFSVGSLVNELPKHCGKCESTSLGFSHRVVEENDYYSVLCNSCRAELRYGQYKKGGLFPKGWQDAYQKQATTIAKQQKTQQASFASAPLNDADVPF